MRGEVPTRDEWERACKLISHMASYVGKMAPGNYGEFYADLNAHWISEQRLSEPAAPTARLGDLSKEGD